MLVRWFEGVRCSEAGARFYGFYSVNTNISRHRPACLKTCVQCKDGARCG